MGGISPQARPHTEDAVNSNDGFLQALVSGGDSRLVADPVTGLNRYLCPPTPARDLACLGSCTATPISAAGFEASRQCYLDVVETDSEAVARASIARWYNRLRGALLAYFDTGDVADVELLPSGTDAVLLTAALLALEHGGRPVTAILPSASETGTGVPRAAAGRGFDPGPSFDIPLPDVAVDTLEVALRTADGASRGHDELSVAFRHAAASARARVVVYLTHCSKTGLVAPIDVPPDVDVVVDACQMRIAPTVVRACLDKGWPVIVTGSKFLGGPPFSGALLLPRGRFASVRDKALRAFRMTAAGVAAANDLAAQLGPLLRWIAALEVTPALATIGADTPTVIGRLMRDAEDTLSQLPGVRIVPGPCQAMSNAGGWPSSIITFAIPYPTDPTRFMTADELRPLYQRLARLGVLIGQPIALGRFGGLRVALSAQDVVAGEVEGSLQRLTKALSEVLKPIR